MRHERADVGDYQQLDTAAAVRHRRSFLVMGLIIICFVAAGGHITGASLLWGAVDLERPWVLYLAGLLTYAYLRWQYRLAVPAGMRLFYREFCDTLFRQPEIKDSATRALREEPKAPREPSIDAAESEIAMGFFARPTVAFTRSRLPGNADWQKLPEGPL